MGAFEKVVREEEDVVEEFAEESTKKSSEQKDQEVLTATVTKKKALVFSDTSYKADPQIIECASGEKVQVDDIVEEDARETDAKAPELILRERKKKKKKKRKLTRRVRKGTPGRFVAGEGWIYACCAAMLMGIVEMKDAAAGIAFASVVAGFLRYGDDIEEATHFAVYDGK